MKTYCVRGARVLGDWVDKLAHWCEDWEGPSLLRLPVIIVALQLGILGVALDFIGGADKEAEKA